MAELELGKAQWTTVVERRRMATAQSWNGVQLSGGGGQQWESHHLPAPFDRYLSKAEKSSHSHGHGHGHGHGRTGPALTMWPMKSGGWLGPGLEESDDEGRLHPE